MKRRQQPKGAKPNKQRACGKRRFRDHDEAIAALRLVRTASSRQTVPARVYECNFCHGWHLTSRS